MQHASALSTILIKLQYLLPFELVFQRSLCKIYIIVDIQFCKDCNDKSIPKEIAVISLEDNFIAHWLVLPPYSLKKLDDKSRRQNNWLHKNHHGTTWAEEDVTQKRVRENLKDIFEYSGKLYVRGRDKVLFLQDFSTNEIINLEENDACPSFHDLIWTNTYCMYHAAKFSYLSLHCALNNAAKLKNHLKSLNEQSGDFLSSFASLESYDRSLSERYDTKNLGEACSVGVQHG